MLLKTVTGVANMRSRESSDYPPCGCESSPRSDYLFGLPEGEYSGMSFGRWRVEKTSFHCFVQWSHWNSLSVSPTPVVSMSRIVADWQKGQMPIVFTCLLPEYMI